MNSPTSTIELIALNIIKWGVDRNIIGGATAKKQFLKLASEFGELGDAIAKNDIEGIKDGVGDSLVVLVMIAAITGEHDHFVAALPEVCSYRATFEIEYDIESVYAMALDKISYLGLNLSGGGTYRFNSLERCAQYLSMIAARYELTMETCALHAYGEIKDRTGVLFNGTFIKSTDARYDDAMAQISAQRLANEK